MNDSEIYKGTPAKVDHFENVTTDSFVVEESGSYKLEFAGLGGIGDREGDHTTFLDNVKIIEAVAVSKKDGFQPVPLGPTPGKK